MGLGTIEDGNEIGRGREKPDLESRAEVTDAMTGLADARTRTDTDAK